MGTVSRVSVVVTCLALGLGLNSAVAGIDKRMFDAHERGTLAMLDRFSSVVVDDLAKVEQAWAVTNHHRQYGAGHDHSEELQAKLCTLAFRIINTQRAISERKSGYRVVAPATLHNYHQSVRAALLAANPYLSRPVDCASLSVSDFRMLYSMASVVRTERQKAHALATSRRQTLPGVVWSNTLSLELAPLPFKLELLDGSLKLKLTQGVGPLRFDFQSGPKLHRASGPTGLRFLVIQLPDRTARVLDIEGMRLSFNLPASRVTIDRDTLMIECLEQCQEALQ